MPEPFDVYDYAAYLRARWIFIVVACGSAVALAFLASWTQPKEYTATVTLVIEPGGDARSANVVSPVYLESLKTYETFATSDVTFQLALQQFKQRVSLPGSSLESLKKSILRVTKLRDTRILQINATLPSPDVALAFAQFIADRTVQLNKSVSSESGQDFIDTAEKELAASKAARDRAEAAWAAFKERGAIDMLQEEINSLLELKARAQRQLMAGNVEVAGLEAQPAATGNTKADLAAARAKASLLARQYAEANQEFERKNNYLTQIISRRDALQDTLDESRKACQRAEDRMQELRTAAGLHGERLRIIDSGAVPSHPSSPKTFRNMQAALLLALVASLAYLSVAYTSKRRSDGLAPARLRVFDDIKRS